jgi:hypothetical protein
MKIIVAVISMILSGCLSNMPASADKINDETGGFVEFTDKKARAIDLTPLREKSLAHGNKEIRIWVGFGVVSPEDLLIINIDNSGNVSGRKVLTYNRDPEDWKDDPEELEYFLDSIYSRCELIGSFKHLESCGLKHNEIFDWSKIYTKLEKLDIWTLPDESKLPELEIVILDGFSVFVELHDSISYRAYHYGNPGFRKDKEAQNASEIMSFVLGL